MSESGPGKQGSKLERCAGKRALFPLKTTGTDLSPLGVLNASESQVADAPASVDAVDLQLGELKGGVKGLGTDPDDNRVDG